jgi:hypothetical protein
MKLWAAIVALVLLFALVISIAIGFKPLEVYVTSDWNEAAKYERECRGVTTVVQVWDTKGRHFEMTCETDND